MGVNLVSTPDSWSTGRMLKRKQIKRNPMARDLMNPKYRKRIVKSKKLYTRKKVKEKSILDFFYECDIIATIA